MITALAAVVAAYVCFDVVYAFLTQRLLGVPGLGGTPVFALYGCDYLAWAAAVTKGDFSISLMFETYTFLNTQSTVRFFCCASRHELALQPAVQHFTEKNFGLSSELWSEGEAKPAHILRRLLAPGNLTTRNAQLCRSLLQLRHQYFVQPKVDLTEALPAWVMHATAEALFGERFLTEIMPAPVLIEHLQQFDAEFEGAASPLPAALFPGFLRARAALLAAFREATRKDVLRDTIAEVVCQSSGVPAEQHPNTLLALLWAGLTNVSASVFWAIAFLLLPEHAHWRHSVQRQMAAARAAVAEGSPLQDAVAAVLQGALSGGEASIVHGCVSEALRLRAQGIVLRKAVKPLRIPQPDMPKSDISQTSRILEIPAGRLVAISPYQIHHNPRFFERPEVFNPERHAGVAPMVNKPAQAHSERCLHQVSKDSIGSGSAGTCREAQWPKEGATPAGELPRTRVAFGAGLFRCPGRSFALAEAALAVGIFFSCYNSCLMHGPEMRDTGVDAKPLPHSTEGSADSPRSCRKHGKHAPDPDTSATHGMGPAGAATVKQAQSGACSSVTFGAVRAGMNRADLAADALAPTWLRQHVVPGQHVVARGVRSGDATGLLPSFEPRLLVGVKKPVGSLWATCPAVS